MKLISAPQNEAVLSNVGEIGEFRIRNSAKAFSILSSGLYANKIRAIIRELSCNAYDSHVAAGKREVPFELHLPNTFSPHFSIRDFGTGLNHEQVTNIYTTYFESTKSDSNDFVGALGLGSKSPFSYTENFTVTTWRDGLKGIYTAFINDQGVPSIALMTAEETDEPNGVEVKFAVDNRNDFYKFRDEASQVLTYFDTQPTVLGADGFEVRKVEYLEENIIPGVSQLDNRYGSVAIMGNIAYPIELPNKLDPHLQRLLDWVSLELRFEIGELDFQASREGLSYIPETIAAIETRLQTLYDKIEARVAETMTTVENKWERARFITKHTASSRTVDTVVLSGTDWKEFVGVKTDPRFDYSDGLMLLPVTEIAQKFNIDIRVIYQRDAQLTVSKPHQRVYRKQYVTMCHVVSLGDKDVHWVVNDTAVGPFERTRYHYKNHESGYHTIYIITKADPKKPMRLQHFLRWVYNPPNVRKVSELQQKPRKEAISVPVMEMRTAYSGWRDAGSSDKIAGDRIYYVPLSNFSLISDYGYEQVVNIKRFAEEAKIFEGTIYGVRKAGLEAIKQDDRWVNFEDYLKEQLSDVDDEVIQALAIGSVSEVRFQRKVDLDEIEDQTCPYVEAVKMLTDHTRITSRQLLPLLTRYNKDTMKRVTETVDKMIELCNTVQESYPLLNKIDVWTDPKLVTDYINLVNKAR